MGDASGLMSKTLTGDLRPQRYVFLIRLDQPDTVEQAIRAASTLRGGIRSVMVPVDEDGASTLSPLASNRSRWNSGIRIRLMPNIHF